MLNMMNIKTGESTKDIDMKATESTPAPTHPTRRHPNRLHSGPVSIELRFHKNT